jgi:peptide/nickel transport system substrate-binding protein
VVNNFLRGYALKGWGPMAPNMWGHNKAMPQYTLDMAKAKQLLTEAGYPSGGFSITYHYLTTAPEQRQIGEMLQANLAKLGIELKMQAQTWAALTALVWNPKTDPYMFTIYIWPEVPDPHNYLYNWFHTSQIGNNHYNGFQYSNAKVDALLDEAKSITDRAQRIKLYEQAQEIINGEAASIFSHTPTRTHAWSMRSNVKGFAFSPFYIGTLDYWNLYKEGGL